MSAPSPPSHLRVNLTSRPMSQSSTNVLDTVTEEECAGCELPAVVTSTTAISLHRATHRLAEEARGQPRGGIDAIPSSETKREFLGF